MAAGLDPYFLMDPELAKSWVVAVGLARPSAHFF
jgi:hypothetical protein